MGEKRNQERNILINIGKAIQFWRKLEGYDQNSLSMALKTARSYVSRLESGHSGISLSRVEKIAYLLGVSPYTLLRGMPEKEEKEALLELYEDPDYKITKAELEDLFSARLKGKIMTRDFYVNMLSIIRSGIYTR